MRNERPLGVRLNNPGNLRVGTNWKGLVARSSDETDHEREFCKFESLEYGLRALYRVLDTYISKHGLTSVKSIVHRYAPPSDGNETDRYADFVSNYLSKRHWIIPDSESNFLESNDMTYDSLDRNFLLDLGKAIVTMEIGREYAEKISPETYGRGLTLSGYPLKVKSSVPLKSASAVAALAVGGATTDIYGAAVGKAIEAATTLEGDTVTMILKVVTITLILGLVGYLANAKRSGE